MNNSFRKKSWSSYVVGVGIIYVLAFPELQGLISGFGDWGKVTVADVTGLSPWLFIAAIVALQSLLDFSPHRPAPR